MCFVDLEPCEVWCETPRKARKEHKCSSCCRTITKGETYHTHFSVLEGDATQEKICGQCFADRETFAEAHDGQLCTPSYLRDMLRECIYDGDPESAKWKPMLERIDAQRKAASG